MSKTQTKNQNLTHDERVKSASIMHAIEVESSFKLYSYRIISHEQYVARISELIAIFNKETSND